MFLPSAQTSDGVLEMPHNGEMLRGPRLDSALIPSESRRNHRWFIPPCNVGESSRPAQIPEQISKLPYRVCFGLGCGIGIKTFPAHPYNTRCDSKSSASFFQTVSNAAAIVRNGQRFPDRLFVRINPVRRRRATILCRTQYAHRSEWPRTTNNVHLSSADNHLAAQAVALIIERFPASGRI